MTRLYSLCLFWFALCLLSGLGIAEVCSFFMVDEYANKTGFVGAIGLCVLGAMYGDWW